ncbi:MAG: septum formation protein Maf [Bacteroidales bacterium]|nr:septum formation protein Maf [Bacteroidales bacterium]
MILNERLKDYKIILASKSPRRQQLLKGLDVDFEIRLKEVEEVVPENIPGSQVAGYLAELKASAFSITEISEKDILITADTVVLIDGEILGKPKDRNDAESMIRKLSGNKHEVITGVCIKTKKLQHVFSSISQVFFKDISEHEISYYLDHYKPYDKAGSYGIQEWIGYIAIERIEGSYFNVMGLPVHQLYEELSNLNLE